VLFRVTEWLAQGNHRVGFAAILFALATLIGVAAFLQAARPSSAGVVDSSDARNQAFARWWSGSAKDRQQLVTRRTGVCPDAPFILPAEGYIGLLYGDPRSPYAEDHRHQGIDIFSLADAGQTSVIAAYGGYLTREAGWKSAVIMRVPDDPLHPGRQIWLYYTHMADSSGDTSYVNPVYPPDTREVFVEQGTLLGHTGSYSGNPFNPVGVHLHFSIVVDNGFGSYANELDFNNTIDPSRYLGIPVNVACAPVVPACDPDPLCDDAILSQAGS